MIGTAGCEEIRLELGVYVLGAIGAADRSAVRAHLACCADCRDALAELAGLPGLLSRVSEHDADGLLRYRDQGDGAPVLGGSRMTKFQVRRMETKPCATDGG